MPNLQTCTFWCDWPMKSRYASHGFNFTCQCWKIPLFHIHAGCRCVWRWSCTLIHRSLLFLWPTRTNPQVSTLIRVVSYLFRAHRMANIDIYMLESFFFSGTSVTSTCMQHTLAKLRACELTFIRNLLQFPHAATSLQDPKLQLALEALLAYGKNLFH